MPFSRRAQSFLPVIPECPSKAQGAQDLFSGPSKGSPAPKSSLDRKYGWLHGAPKLPCAPKLKLTPQNMEEERWICQPPTARKTISAHSIESFRKRVSECRCSERQQAALSVPFCAPFHSASTAGGSEGLRSPCSSSTFHNASHVHFTTGP